MEILTACLCDSAADYQGKLCILGAFDTIAAPEFPCTHPHSSIAIRLLLRDEDVGDHHLEIDVVDPDGRSVIPAAKRPNILFHIAPLAPEVFFVSQNFVINFQGLPGREPGQYELRILLDGEVSRAIPFQFVQRPAQENLAQ